MKKQILVIILLWISTLSSSMNHDHHYEEKKGDQKITTILDTFLLPDLVKIIGEYVLLEHWQTKTYFREKLCQRSFIRHQLSDNGQQLVIHDHGCVSLCSLVTGRESTFFTHPKSEYIETYMDPNCSELLVTRRNDCFERKAQLVYNAGGQTYREPVNDKYYLYSGRFSTTGKYIAAFWSQKKNKEKYGFGIFDAASGKRLSSRNGIDSSGRCIAFNSNDTMIAVDEDRNGISLSGIDLAWIILLPTRNLCHTSLQFSHDNKRLISSQADQINLWDITSGKLLKQHHMPHYVDAVSFVKNDTLLAVTQKNYIQFIIPDTGEAVASYYFPVPFDRKPMITSRDGHTMVVLNQEKSHILVDPMRYLQYEALQAEKNVPEKAPIITRKKRKIRDDFDMNNFCVLQ